jgi:hypothetical protein
MMTWQWYPLTLSIHHMLAVLPFPFVHDLIFLGDFSMAIHEAMSPQALKTQAISINHGALAILLTLIILPMIEIAIPISESTQSLELIFQKDTGVLPITSIQPLVDTCSSELPILERPIVLELAWNNQFRFTSARTMMKSSSVSRPVRPVVLAHATWSGIFPVAIIRVTLKGDPFSVPISLTVFPNTFIKISISMHKSSSPVESADLQRPLIHCAVIPDLLACGCTIAKVQFFGPMESLTLVNCVKNKISFEN